MDGHDPAVELAKCVATTSRSSSEPALLGRPCAGRFGVLMRSLRQCYRAERVILDRLSIDFKLNCYWICALQSERIRGST